MVVCVVTVRDVQPEIRPEVTRKMQKTFETTDCADETDESLFSSNRKKYGRPTPKDLQGYVKR